MKHANNLFIVFLGKSSWEKPQDLKYIDLSDLSAKDARHPKMQDEVALNNDNQYNPLPPPSTQIQNIPLHNPSQDYYLFTNTPVSQSDNLQIPATLPLPPHPPPHLVQMGDRRVADDDHIEIQR